MHSHVLEFIEPDNLPLNSLDLNPVDYSMYMQTVATNGISSNKISDTDQLINQAAAKKTDDGYQGKWCHVEFRMD